MKLLIIALLFTITVNGQITARIERFNDSLSNTYYPVTWVEAYHGNFGLIYWQNLQGHIYPYLNLYLLYKHWWLGYNPLPADIYNPKLQLGVDISLNKRK